MNTLLTSIPREGPLAQRGISLLIYSGWALTLLYFPSGVLLFYFGNAVYVRELLLAAHLIACLLWLHRTGDLRWVTRQSAILLLVPLFLLPAVADPDYRFEALRTVKWTFFWLDWIFIGYFAFQKRRWDQWLGIFIGLTAMELLLEALVGAYEWQAGRYVFSTPTTWNERTIFGVQNVKELTLMGKIRVRGLQRDVFSFANLMAMSSVLGLAVASLVRPFRQRVAGFVWAVFFAVMLVVSGGRSALLGIFATAVLAVAYTVDYRFTHKWSKLYLLAWVGIAVLISFTGVGTITDAVSGTFFGKSHIGDASSAYMRDDNWDNLQTALEQEPIILVTGAPIGALIDSRIAPMFHWADNQILWDIYHLGLAGALAIAFYFFRVMWVGRAIPQFRAMDVLILCLLFVLGEGVARESLTFMGCMPLFVACGYSTAASAASIATAPRSEPTKPRSGRRRRSKALGPT